MYSTPVANPEVHAENGLTDRFRALLHGLWDDLLTLDRRIETLDGDIESIAKGNQLSYETYQLEGHPGRPVPVRRLQGVDHLGSHSETSRQKKAGGVGSISKTQSFFQSVPLNAPVDVDHSHAKLLKNGKLKVVLPRKL